LIPNRVNSKQPQRAECRVPFAVHERPRAHRPARLLAAGALPRHQPPPPLPPLHQNARDHRPPAHGPDPPQGL